MSTLSGVFPNAITPNFAPAVDPAEQSRQRRQNETVVFAPIDEVEQNSATRRPNIEQPGRLEAEQSAEVVGRLKNLQSEIAPQARDSANTQETSKGENAKQDARAEESSKADARRAEQEEVKLQQDIDLIRELASRDREVRAHEQAHQSVGGQHAGAMEFTFRQGPDGKRYAVGGEVSIDVAKVPGNPDATALKAEQIRRAALAPAEPSAQDRQVAALASQIAIEAQNESRQIEQQESQKASEEREEQKAISEESSQKVDASSETDKEKSTQVAAESDDRIDSIFEKTSQAVETAISAAYQTKSQQDVGFNLDTTI